MSTRIIRGLSLICTVGYLIIFALLVNFSSRAWAMDEDLDVSNLPMSSIPSNSRMDFSHAKSLPYMTPDKVLFENVLIQNEPYIITMHSTPGGVMAPISKSEISTVEIPFGSINVDGYDDDWVGILPVVEDPAGDDDPIYSSVPGTDLANVYIARDNTYLYFLMTLHDGDPNTEIGTVYFVEFTQYLTQIHTPGDRTSSAGCDSSGACSVGVGDRTGTILTRYPSDNVGLGTGLLEWKVPIQDMQYPANTPAYCCSPSPPPPGIENQFIRAYIHPGPHPNPPPVSDGNDLLTRPMIINFYP